MEHLCSVVPALCCSADSAACSHLLNKVLFLSVIAVIAGGYRDPTEVQEFYVKQFPDRQPYSLCMQGNSQGFPAKLTRVILLVFMKPGGVVQMSK